MPIKIVNRVLLVNDDGIDAPGFVHLTNIAKQIANEVWIVAPVIDQSGVSCSVSLKTPFRVSKRSEREYAVYGTPADCSLFAIKYLMVDCLPDLVLSGINSGSNVGFETMISGTVGGAIMAMALGIPAIAFSQFTPENHQPTNWDASIHHASTVIEKLFALSLPPSICFNVNFPDCAANKVKGIKITRQGEHDVSNFVVKPATDPEGNDYYWFRAKRNQNVFGEDNELDTANNSYISVTPIGYERTNYAFYEKLQKEFDTEK